MWRAIEEWKIGCRLGRKPSDLEKNMVFNSPPIQIKKVIKQGTLRDRSYNKDRDRRYRRERKDRSQRAGGRSREKDQGEKLRDRGLKKQEQMAKHVRKENETE